MRYISKRLQDKNIIEQTNKLYLQILATIIYNFEKAFKRLLIATIKIEGKLLSTNLQLQ